MLRPLSLHRSNNQSFSPPLLVITIQIAIPSFLFTMAHQINFDQYLAFISHFTYEQLEQEQARLFVMSVHLTNLRNRVDNEYRDEVDLFGHIIDNLNGSIDLQMERMAHIDYLDHVNPAEHVQEQQVLNHLLNIREEIDNALEQVRLAHRQDALIISESARQIAFLSSLATWVHLLKVERQDLV